MISHSLMVHARVSEDYIHFALMYLEDHIFPVLAIKYLMNQNGEPTTPSKLATGTKPSMLHLCVLFCPCFVQESTAHFGERALNMSHQVQTCFWGIFL